MDAETKPPPRWLFCCPYPISTVVEFAVGRAVSIGIWTGRCCGTTWRTGPTCIGRNSGSSRTGPCLFTNPMLTPPRAGVRLSRSGAGEESVEAASGRIMKNNVSPACAAKCRRRRLSACEGRKKSSLRK
jgi:hypothetical protein